MHTTRYKLLQALRAAGTLLVIVLLAASPLAAQTLQSGDVASLQAPASEFSVAQSGGPSLSQAVDQVKRQCKDCRIISAETKRQGNREMHQIKALTPDNKVRTFRIPGRTLSSRG